MNAIDFYDFLALLLRYAGGLVAICAFLIALGLTAIIIDHYRWTRRFDRTQVLDLVTAVLWTAAATICVLCTF